MTTGGYPGELRKLLGIWVEEIDALLPEQKNRIVLKETYGDLQGEYGCGMLCDLLHSEGAEVIAEYGDDFYKGMPVVTVIPLAKVKPGTLHPTRMSASWMVCWDSSADQERRILA